MHLNVGRADHLYKEGIVICLHTEEDWVDFKSIFKSFFFFFSFKLMLILEEQGLEIWSNELCKQKVLGNKDVSLCTYMLII